jgi:hypothetical protein
MIDPNRILWQHVLQQAFMDATSESTAQVQSSASAAGKGSREQLSADRWIRDCGRDFRMVCSLAGMDADFLSGAYRAGRVNGEWLRQDPKRIGTTWSERHRAEVRETARRRYHQRKGAA